MNRKIKNLNLMNTTDLRKLIKFLLEKKVNFHPDDDYLTFIKGNGKRAFSYAVGSKINEYFSLAKKVFTDEHLYKIIRQELRKFNLKELEEVNK